MILLILIGLGVWDFLSPEFNFPLWGWIVGGVLAIVELALYTGGKILDWVSDIADAF